MGFCPEAFMSPLSAFRLWGKCSLAEISIWTHLSLISPKARGASKADWPYSASWASSFFGGQLMVDFLYHNPTRTQLLRLPVTQFEGLSLPDLDHLAARGPHQHGATYVATYLRPRELSLQFYLRGCDAKEFESRHR